MTKEERAKDKQEALELLKKFMEEQEQSVSNFVQTLEEKTEKSE